MSFYHHRRNYQPNKIPKNSKFNLNNHLKAIEYQITYYTKLQQDFTSLQNYYHHKIAIMAENSIAELITALNRREDIKAIPNFSGNATDQYISSWLSEAELIATIHNWEPR